MAGIGTITGAGLSLEFKGQCNNPQTGAAYPGQSSGIDIRKSLSFSTAIGNAQSGGGDEIFSFQTAIAGGASLTQDLTAMTNLMAQANVNIVRIKGMQIRLLSAAATGASIADDTTIQTPVASQICVTNNGPAVPIQLDFGAGGSGFTVTLTTAVGVVTNVAVGAGGTGYPPSSTFLCAPQQAGGSGCLFTATTNASGVVTSVALVGGQGGAGYSNATAPTCVIGQYPINNGGAHAYGDPLAAGFAPISATNKNIRIYNLDPANVATVEFDFLAATS